MEPLVDKATSKVDPHHVIYEFKGTLPGENSVIVARWHTGYLDSEGLIVNSEEEYEDEDE